MRSEELEIMEGNEYSFEGAALSELLFSYSASLSVTIQASKAVSSSAPQLLLTRLTAQPPRAPFCHFCALILQGFRGQSLGCNV